MSSDVTIRTIGQRIRTEEGDDNFNVDLTDQEFNMVRVLMTAPEFQEILRKIAETGYLLKCKQVNQRG